MADEYGRAPQYGAKTNPAAAAALVRSDQPASAPALPPATPEPSE